MRTGLASCAGEEDGRGAVGGTKWSEMLAAAHSDRLEESRVIGGEDRRVDTCSVNRTRQSTWGGGRRGCRRRGPAVPAEEEKGGEDWGRREGRNFRASRLQLRGDAREYCVVQSVYAVLR